MRFRLFGVAIPCFAVLLTFGLVFNAVAQDKAAKAPKSANIQGSVRMIDKASSTITVATRGDVTRQVVYTADTKFLYGHSKDNKPGSLDQVKEGNFISCAGTFSGVKLDAKECVYREGK